MSTKITEPTILSVLEAVAYMDEHYQYPDEKREHLCSESMVRRLLKNGRLPSARTARGHLGIRVTDIDAYWADRR